VSVGVALLHARRLLVAARGLVVDDRLAPMHRGVLGDAAFLITNGVCAGFDCALTRVSRR
jgi:hypothetical protein